MKYQSILLIAFLLITYSACKDKLTPQEECIASFLNQSNMEPYTGQTSTDCRFFAYLYEYDGGFFFQLDSHCADMISNPLNCNNEPLCDFGNSENCDVYDNAVYLGIVGVNE